MSNFSMRFIFSSLRLNKCVYRVAGNEKAPASRYLDQFRRLLRGLPNGKSAAAAVESPWAHIPSSIWIVV
jgi:hypothetical protein